MNYTICQGVEVTEQDVEQVGAGHLYVGGRQVFLAAQTDSESVFAVRKDGGNLVWIELVNPELERLVTRYEKHGTRLVPGHYGNGTVIEMPFEKRRGFLAALARIP